MVCTHACPKLAPRLCVDVRSPNERATHTVQGLQRLLRSSETDFQKLQAAYITSKLWTTGSTITVGFMATTPGETADTNAWAWKRAWIASVVEREFAVFPNVTFQFKLNPTDAAACSIRIAFDATLGCWSRLGTDALQNWGGANVSMNFGWMDAPLSHTFVYGGQTYSTPASFEQGGYPGQGTTIVHEFGHAMGMIHEHQSPFNNPLTWNVNAVYAMFEGPPNNWSRAEIDSNIIQRYSALGLNGSAFDPYSIMKYVFPSSLLLNPTSTQAADVERKNYVMSPCDKYWLATNYPGKMSVSDLANLAQMCSDNTGGGLVGTPAWIIAVEVIMVVVLVWIAWRVWTQSK